jgi:hypothetical protein
MWKFAYMQWRERIRRVAGLHAHMHLTCSGHSFACLHAWGPQEGNLPCLLFSAAQLLGLLNRSFALERKSAHGTRNIY